MGQQKTRKQHYVWRKYLAPWTTDGRVWCRRKDAVFRTDLMNIAQERDFYSPSPLTALDERFLRMEAAGTKIRANIEIVEEEIALRRDMFAALEDAKRGGDSKRIAEVEALVHNSEENYQAKIEHSGAELLDALVRGDIAWATDDAEWREFCLFFATQYLRTKRVQEHIRANLESQAERLGYSVERVWPISRMIDTVRLAQGIHRNTSLVLIESTDGLEFITGDQPTFNAKAPAASPGAVPGEHEFVYPVSPKRAALLIDGQPRSEPCMRKAAHDEVQRYNQVIRNVSLEQVFARRREDL